MEVSAFVTENWCAFLDISALFILPIIVSSDAVKRTAPFRSDTETETAGSVENPG